MVRADYTKDSLSMRTFFFFCFVFFVCKIGAINILLKLRLVRKSHKLHYDVHKSQIYLGLGISFLQCPLADFWNMYRVAIRCTHEFHL